MKMPSLWGASMLLLVGTLLPAIAHGYLPASQMKDPYVSDILLHELVNRMGSDLIDMSDSYIEPMPSAQERLTLMARANKDLEAEQLDYDSLLNVGNSNPSLRDQEYMQHSSLWGHQFVDGGSAEVGAHAFKSQPKTDATLPAYCNPPNPCPVGHTEDQGCIENFENTAAFSREYQASQECMCDSEHMFDCSEPKDGPAIQRRMNSDFESFLARHFQNAANGNGFMTKKFGSSYRNPFLGGEKLPIAAKKGNKIY